MSQEVVQCAAQNKQLSYVGSTVEQRHALYQKSIEDPSKFWSEIADTFYWKKKWDQGKPVFSYNFDADKGPIRQEWFSGGLTNVCYNAIDRWLPEHANEVAFYWEGNEVNESAALTYGQLHEEVKNLATAMRTEYGIKKGDRVSLYLPMINLGPIAMMACARIGAVCSVIFGGFSASSLSTRIIDSQSSLLITAEQTMRGRKPIPLWKVADEALNACAKAGVNCKALIYERHSRQGIQTVQGRDQWYQDVVKPTTDDHIEWVESEDPLFILYTSGSTGTPKAVVHTTGGYMIYAATTFKYAFDYRPGEVYFCTADIGWITGHTYVTYGPLLCRATSVIYEGVPTYPNAGRWWEIVDKHNVSQFYTAPTAIRTLMKAGDKWVKASKRANLRALGTVGEPIDVTAWHWYHKVVGEGRADVIDTWWQTETGGPMLTPLPGCTPQKPGCASLPFFGVKPAILDPVSGKKIPDGKPGHGVLCMEFPWPGMARTLFNNEARYIESYFSQYKGYYFTGDGARRDEDGYIWLTGRVDDVVNISGHRMGTGEVESAINQNPLVVESAVVGMPHPVKGEGIYAYVTFKSHVKVDAEAIKSVNQTIRKEIGALAMPEAIQPAPGLPKTRSGKIMRRILRKIAIGAYNDLGDTTTLADPAVVKELIGLRDQWVTKKKGSKL